MFLGLQCNKIDKRRCPDGVARRALGPIFKGPKLRRFEPRRRKVIPLHRSNRFVPGPVRLFTACGGVRIGLEAKN